ncbi:TPA_asm: hypothetical protein PROPHIFSAT01-1_94 [Mycobacterium phage prophiFSAT01-1]|nr:TPA_asm: hypothetical protein PROPHIFSAT01-1_94 [Mycobacterium phage prophiFSAT01-1]
MTDPYAADVYDPLACNYPWACSSRHSAWRLSALKKSRN